VRLARGTLQVSISGLVGIIYTHSKTNNLAVNNLNSKKKINTAPVGMRRLLNIPKSGAQGEILIEKEGIRVRECVV